MDSSKVITVTSEQGPIQLQHIQILDELDFCTWLVLMKTERERNFKYPNMRLALLTTYSTCIFQERLDVM